MKNLMRKSRGFTLVELLIVMIIIGILAGGMMMVMGSSTDKADATKALSDLRTMASATLQYYADDRSAKAPTVAQLSQYMNKALDAADYDVQEVPNASGDQTTWVGVQVRTPGARTKLADMRTQENLILLGITGTGTPGAATLKVSEDFDAAKHVWAYMRAK